MASKLVVANGLVETLAAGESLVAFTRRRTDEDSCVLTTANQGLGGRRHSAISEGSGSCVEQLVVSATRLYWMVSYEPIYGGNLHGYSRGLELTVLSLSSGRRAIVELPDHAGPIGAALTTAGLYYTYDVPRAASPGRVGFVPRGRLTARVG